MSKESLLDIKNPEDIHEHGETYLPEEIGNMLISVLAGLAAFIFVMILIFIT